MADPCGSCGRLVHLTASLLEHVSAEPLVTLDTLSLVQQLPDGATIDELPQKLTALCEQRVWPCSSSRVCATVAHDRSSRSCSRECRHRLAQQGAAMSVEY